MSDTGRDAPKVRGRRRFALTTKQQVAVYGLLAGAVIGFNFYRQDSSSDDVPRPTTQTSIQPVSNFDFLRDEPRRPDPAEAAAQQQPRPQPQGGFGFSNPFSQEPERKRMLSYSAPANRQQPPSPAPAAAPSGGSPPPVAPPAPGGGPAGPTAVSWGSATLAGRRAGAAIDTTLTLMPGLYGCTLDVAINSERPGPFYCHTEHDIRSPAGAVLMERGTRIVGNHQSDARPGQGRIVSLAAVAWTPAGVPVPLGNAPVGDALGRTGMDGQVDTHLWSRLGGAIILMMTQGAFSMGQAALQSSLNRGNGNSYFNLNTGGVEGAISEALRQGGSIQNTVTKNQGETITFMVTEPISFGDAYSLEPR